MGSCAAAVCMKVHVCTCDVHVCTCDVHVCARACAQVCARARLRMYTLGAWAMLQQHSREGRLHCREGQLWAAACKRAAVWKAQSGAPALEKSKALRLWRPSVQVQIHWPQAFPLVHQPNTVLVEVSRVQRRILHIHQPHTASVKDLA